MINFSPKANLRHPDSYSNISEFTQGGFREVYDDVQADASAIKKVLMCSGKLYFDLDEKRKKENRTDVAIIRLEQLYPLPQNQLDELYKKYGKAIWYWVQEEPMNMGAATYLRMNLQNINFYIISRQASAATATGFAKVHAREQAELLEAAFKK
jgi:2-oxoglutarate dehydrogenase E1 component